MARPKSVVKGDLKSCTKCGQYKPFDQFAKDKTPACGRYASCKSCNRDRIAANTAASKLRKRVYDKEYRKTLGLKKAANQYKVSASDLHALLSMQGEVCAICKKPETQKHQTGVDMRLAIDHCHATGDVRGFLCSVCNRGLGYFKDSVELLQIAIDYLRHTPYTKLREGSKS